MRIFQFLMVFIALFFVQQGAYAQNAQIKGITCNGQVVQNCKALANVVVTVDKQSMTTQSNGFFSFTVPKGKTVTVTGKLAGYKETRKSCFVNSDPTWCSLAMEKAPNEIIKGKIKGSVKSKKSGAKIAAKIEIEGVSGVINYDGNNDWLKDGLDVKNYKVKALAEHYEAGEKLCNVIGNQESRCDIDLIPKPGNLKVEVLSENDKQKVASDFSVSGENKNINESYDGKTAKEIKGLAAGEYIIVAKPKDNKFLEGNKKCHVNPGVTSDCTVVVPKKKVNSVKIKGVIHEENSPSTHLNAVVKIDIEGSEEFYTSPQNGLEWFFVVTSERKSYTLSARAAGYMDGVKHCEIPEGVDTVDCSFGLKATASSMIVSVYDALTRTPIAAKVSVYQSSGLMFKEIDYTGTEEFITLEDIAVDDYKLEAKAATYTNKEIICSVKKGISVNCPIELFKENQNVGVIKGFLVDSNDDSKKLSGIVSLVGRETLKYDGVNDFRFEVAESDTYSLIGSSDGYRDAKVDCIVNVGTSSHCPIQLSLSNGSEKDKIPDDGQVNEDIDPIDEADIYPSACSVKQNLRTVLYGNVFMAILAMLIGMAIVFSRKFLKF